MDRSYARQVGMSFHINHRYGGADGDVPLQALDSLIAELHEDPTDIEHPCVSLVHESGWALGVYVSGVVTLENVEDLAIEPRHMQLRRPEAARGLLEALARGQLDRVFSADWVPGYGQSD